MWLVGTWNKKKKIHICMVLTLAGLHSPMYLVAVSELWGRTKGFLLVALPQVQSLLSVQMGPLAVLGPA